jgi:hypothetical protein
MSALIYYTLAECGQHKDKKRFVASSDFRGVSYSGYGDLEMDALFDLKREITDANPKESTFIWMEKNDG